MPDDAFYDLNEIDPEFLDDFMCSLYESLDLLEHDLVVLERDPQNEKAIHSLFRTVHTLKGNARMCMLDPMSDYMHCIEDVMSEVRAQRLTFTSLIKEAVLLSLDQMRTESEAMIQTHELQLSSMQIVQQSFVRMKSATPMDAEMLAAEVIRHLGGEFAQELPIIESQSDNNHHPEPTAQIQPSTSSEIIDAGAIKKDLMFFRDISLRIDEICPYWESRSSRLLECCLRINRYLDTPVDAMQLSTAVFLHDLGMSFISRDIINKNGKLSPIEEKEIKRHVKVGYEWISRIPLWQEAALMVQQHHERPDGQGYPEKLTNDQICAGAKILAIADTFFAITNERADRNHKRSLLRAAKEINSHASSQFDADTVLAFNQMLKDQYSRKTPVVKGA
jgi:two-component system response regulator RpfG